MSNLLDKAFEEQGVNLLDLALQEQGFSKDIAPQYSGPNAPVSLPSQEEHGDNPVSRALKDTLSGTGGAIMKGLEFLDRPRSTLVATVQALKGDKDSSAIGKAWSGESHPSWGELMPETINVPQFEHGGTLGLKSGEKGELNYKPALALAADMVADPINLLGAGGLTKLGKSGKVLGNLNKIYGKEIGRLLRSRDSNKILKAIAGLEPKVWNYLKSVGVSDEIQKIVSKAVDVLKETLPEQAKAGQWSAFRFGPWHTPTKFNEMVAKGLDATRKTLPDIPLLNKFITGTGDEVYDRAYEEILQRHREKMRDILDKGTDLQESVALGKQRGTFTGGSSTGWFERGGKGDAADIAESILTPQLDEIEAMKRKWYDLGIKPIDEQGYRYAPHVLSEESVGERIRRAFQSKKPSMFTPHKIQRDIVWMTDPATGKEFIGSLSDTAKALNVKPDDIIFRQADVDEINDWFRRLNGGGNTKNLFKEDLSSSVVAGAIDNEVALHGARQLEFFLTTARKDLAGIGGVDEAAKLGWRAPRLKKPERFLLDKGKQIPIRTKMDALEKTPMPKAKARFIESKWKEIVAPDETAAGLKKLFNGYTSLWKRYTLFPFAEYHFRNMVGDIWNGWMSGWKPTEITGDLVEAARIQMMGKSVNALGKKFTPFKGGENVLVKSGLYGDVPAAKVLREAQVRGVVGTGQYGEIQSAFTNLASEKGRSFVEREFYDLETAMKFGAFMEDNRRLALFSRQIKNGETFDDAARIVKKTLYDYSDLTDFEKSLRRWGVPFYSWYRKNIPAQFQHLLKHPGKVATLPKAKGHIEGWNERRVTEEQRPEWMRREFSIHTGADPYGNEEFMTLGSFLPTADLFRFGGSPEDFLTGVLSNMNPAWKIPFELAINRNTFFDRPVDRLRDEDASLWERGGELSGNERTNYLGMNLPTTGVKASEMLPFTRLLSTLDRTNPFGVFDEGAGYEPGIVREGQTKTRPYHTELDTWSKLLKSITGLKVYPSDVERSTIYSLRDKIYQGGRSSGFNKAALQSAIQYALAEGDPKSAEMYTSMLGELLERLGEEAQMFEEYLNSRP